MGDIIVFIIVLSALVLTHELGHFVAAKYVGMRVDEFALGFPPRIFSFKKGETRYSVNLIPFGGYVKIYGEDVDANENVEDVDSNRKFTARPRLSQAIVIVAGVTMNLILAVILFTVGFMNSFPISTSAINPDNAQFIDETNIIVTGITPDSPSDISGITVGTKLIKLENNDEILVPQSASDASKFISESNGSLSLTLEINNTEIVKEVLPVSGIVPDRLAIGISLDSISLISLPIHKAISASIVQTARITWFTVTGLINLIQSAITGNATFASVAGPIGIYNLVGDANELGIAYLLGFVALISIALAVINIAPFPALDGGRLLFLFIETVKGSPINAVVVNTINYIGFAVLIALMIFISYGDLLKLGIF